jgi:hypothetical protein
LYHLELPIEQKHHEHLTREKCSRANKHFQYCRFHDLASP